VVGGAGYIGSHMVKRLGQLGCAVTTLDNLSSGHRDAVLCGDFVHGDLADRGLLKGLIQPGRFDAVMHFASFIQVGESVQHPAKYYENNVVNTLQLLDAMRAAGVQRFIFSSTAATFGEPQYTSIDERHPQAPINPYRWLTRPWRANAWGGHHGLPGWTPWWRMPGAGSNAWRDGSALIRVGGSVS